MLGHYTFGAPSSLLYRSSIVRETEPFFPRTAASADTAACLSLLRHSDFGFVHRILSFERVHAESITSSLVTVNSFLLDRIEFLLKDGRHFLDAAEKDDRLNFLLREYYRDLAAAAVRFREKAYWDYHRARLDEIGLAFSKSRMAKATLSTLLELSLNFDQTARRIARRFRRSVHRPPSDFKCGPVT
jgi:hypothetical protein